MGSAGSYNARGEEFMANMPTEEVFTAPDSRRVDGYVSSTKPLSYLWHNHFGNEIYI